MTFQALTWEEVHKSVNISKKEDLDITWKDIHLNDGLQIFKCFEENDAE
jgi:hypothetical protein